MSRRERWYVCQWCAHEQRLQRRTANDDLHITICTACYACDDATRIPSYLKVPMKQSVVVYSGVSVPGPTPEQMERIRQHFDLDILTVGNGTRDKIEPENTLFVTNVHAPRQASAAGATYMGWAFACKQAGIE